MQYINPPSIPSEPSPLPLPYHLYVSMCVLYISKEDLGKAQECLSQALSMAVTRQAILLQVYLELRNKNTNTALQLLRVHPIPYVQKENQ
jgi:hypothetical protein